MEGVLEGGPVWSSSLTGGTNEHNVIDHAHGEAGGSEGGGRLKSKFERYPTLLWNQIVADAVKCKYNEGKTGYG